MGGFLHRKQARTRKKVCNYACHQANALPSSPPVVRVRTFQPALVDRLLDSPEILFGDFPNKEHLSVVLDRNELGVVHPRFFDQCFAFGIYPKGHRLETKPRLPWFAPGSAVRRVNDAVLAGVDSRLATRSHLVR